VADHRAEQIINAIAERLSGSTSAKDEVYRWSARPLPELPFAIEVSMGPDEPSTTALVVIDSWLTVYVDLYTNSTQPLPRTSAAKPTYETNLMTLRKETAIEMMRDVQQGLSGFVIDTDPQGAQEPEVKSEGETVSVMLRTVWRVQYRASVTDPSQ